MNQKFVKRQKAVVYLESSRMFFFGQESEQVIKLDFPQNIVKSSEVFDKEAFSLLIQNFIQTNHLTASSICVVISDSLLFSKQIKRVQETAPQVGIVTRKDTNTPVIENKNQPTPVQHPAVNQPIVKATPAVATPAIVPRQAVKPKPPGAVELEEIQNNEDGQARLFIDKIPFENILYKIIKLPDGIAIIATNEDFIEDLKHSFSANDSIIEAAIAFNAVATREQFVNGLTAELGKQILLKQDIIKQNNLFEAVKLPEVEIEGETHVKKVVNKIKNLRLFSMLGVFGVLVVILIVVFISTNRQNEVLKKNRKPKPTPSEARKIIPTKTVSTNVSSDSASFSQSTKVSILTRSINKTLSDAIKKDLRNLGIRQISENLSTVASDSAVVTFSPSVPQIARDTILSLLKKNNNKFISSEGDTSPYDFIISF